MRILMSCLIMVSNLYAVCQFNANIKTIDSLVNVIDKIKLTHTDFFTDEDTLSKTILNIKLFQYFDECKLLKCVRETKATEFSNSRYIHVNSSYTYYFNDNNLIKVIGKVNDNDETDTQIYFNNESAFDYFLTVNGKQIHKPYCNSFIIFIKDSKFLLRKFGRYYGKIN